MFSCIIYFQITGTYSEMLMKLNKYYRNFNNPMHFRPNFFFVLISSRTSLNCQSHPSLKFDTNRTEMSDFCVIVRVIRGVANA